MLLENFIITSEVGKNLEVIFKLISEKKGQGIFIEGNFGSGKSHFLTVLASLLEKPAYWKLLAAQDKNLQSFSGILAKEKYTVLKISLVEHASGELLEEIISRSAVEVGLLTANDLVLNRKDRFGRLIANTTLQNAEGVLIVIDELSEFLRSKPDARSYNEEIRFLQYLGELSFKNPLWIVSTLQEKIEDTGEITQETFNKIKDRYPVRLFLGSHHVEELISRRLVKKKGGDEITEKINAIYDYIKSAFQSFPASAEKFNQIYPVHPATIDLLDDLKVLFSQHRGVVDFIHYQIKGDPSRNIPGMMDAPAEHLLTPEFIFDHFQVRIKDTLELNPYLEVVFRYFEKQVPKIFEESDLQTTALRLIKILILAAISPRRVDLNIRQLGDMLLHRITDLDPQVNYRFIADVLGRLYQDGAYLAYQKNEDFLLDVYRIDLEANVNAIVQRKMRAVAADLSRDDGRIYQLIVNEITESFLPLKIFAEQPEIEDECLWQQTTRKGWRFYGNLAEISGDRLRRISAGIRTGELDYLIIVASPEKIESQQKSLQADFRPLLAEFNILDYTILWMPRAIPDSDLMRDYYALSVLLQRYREDHSHTGRRVFEFLQMRIAEEQRKVREAVVNAYLEGELLAGDYPEKIGQAGLLPFNKLMEMMVDRLLNRHFPKHIDIAPYSALYSPGRVNDAIQKFFRAGSIAQESADSSLRATLDNYLKPLGLLARSGNNIVLRVDSRHSPLLQFVMDFVEDEKVEINYLFMRTHHSAYGISRAQFNFLLLALIFSGNAVPYSQERKIAIDKITVYNLDSITAVAKGDVLDDRTLLGLKAIPFIDSKFSGQKLSTRLQEQIYEQVRSKIAGVRENLVYLDRQVEEASRNPQLGSLPFANIQRTADSVMQVLDKIQLGRSSKEGLQSLVEVMERSPLFNEEFEQMQQSVRFFREYKTAYLQIRSYLDHPGLIIPEDDEYRALITMRDEIRQTLEREELIFSDEIHRLADLFREFQKEYVTRYLLEHRQQRGREAYQWIGQARNSRMYQLLRRLSTLRSINVEPSAAQIEARLAEAESGICEFPTAELLRFQPSCTCEFHLGDSVAAVGETLSGISQTIQNGIDAYFRRFRQPDIHQKIREFRQQLQAVNQNDKLKVIDEFTGLKDETAFAAWAEAGNLKVLREALESQLVLHEISIDDLLGPFINRTVELEKLNDHFQKTLSRLGDGQKEVFVRLVEKKATPVRHLPRLIAGKSPFLFNLFPGWEEAEWQRLLAAAIWFNEHELPFSKMLQMFEIQVEKENLAVFRQELEVLRQLVSPHDLGEVQEQSLLDWFEAHYRDSELEQLAEFVRQERHFSQVLRYSLEKALKIAVHREPADARLDAALVFRGPESEYHLSAHHLLKLLPQLFFLKKLLFKQNRGDLSEKNVAWWNQTYLKGIYAIPYLTDLVLRYLRLFDLRSFLHEKILEIVEETRQFCENFQSVFPVLGAEVEENRQSPISITNLLPFVLRENKHSQPRLVLIDGLSWDMFALLKNRFLEGLFPDLKIVKVLAAWTVLPSNTETVMEKLKNSLGELNFESTVNEPAPAFGGRLSEEVELAAGFRLHKINSLDTKIHTSKEDLVVFGSEMLLQVEEDLRRYFGKLEKGGLVLLFSDHGFVQNPKFTEQRKYEQSRYQHGGGTPFEIIVPAVLLQKS